MQINIYPVFLCGAAGKESACSAGDLGSVPGLGRSPGEGKGCALQYSGLENSVDWTVHGVAESWTRLSDFHFTSLCPGDLQKPGVEPGSPALKADSLPSEPPGKLYIFTLEKWEDML